jgi:membrane-anchored protein YejM (alkaline phosphatase superfamily)
MTYNVVVVVVDALRADKVGAVGEQELTPNVDEFAEDAVTFTNAFTTINATDPAVTSLQTGLYPLSNGVINNGIEVTDAEKQSIEQITQLPECLSEAGYRTAKFGRPLGRWHRRGFDIYPSSMETSEAFDVRNESQNLKGRIASGLNSIHPKLQESASRLYNTATEATKNQLPNEEATNKADEDGVVDNISEFVSGDSPFYAFVHLMNTHGPYIADPDHVVSLLNKFDYPVDRGYNPMTDTNHVGDIISSDFQEAILAGEYPEIREKYYFDSGEPSTAIVDAHYDAAVTKADERFGQIIEELRQSSVYEETIVAFLADHGESLTENGIYYNHHGLYDVSTHIPLIIRPPSQWNKQEN